MATRNADADRFEIVRHIGGGAMGDVYEARDGEFGGRVALKVLRLRPDGEALLAFKREFRALRQLRHPNLVRLHELYEASDQWFFTMELVDGTDFLHWVRPESGDAATGLRSESGLARLRTGLRQLALGLDTLHRADIVHRDIKPANILVTHEDRLVLVDFGVAAEGEARPEKRLTGTPAYMAPEQAMETAVAPAADWYSVGVILYQALTNQLPFEGAPLQLLLDKQERAPAPPHETFRDLPEDLSTLCADLLRPDPAERPAADEILARLGVHRQAVRLLRSGRRQQVFVGRDAELAGLRDSHTLAGQSRVGVTHLIYGESGVGKSALVAQFARQVSADTLILTGRCYEHESVPYKAVDGVIDDLSAHLADLAPADLAEIVPEDAGLLLKAFPVLGRLPQLREHRRPQTEHMHPFDMRRELFRELRELLVALAHRRPLLVIIDDLQWADADSLALLRAVMGAPGAPPLLLVGTVRVSRDRSDYIEELLLTSSETVSVELGPLGREDAERLAETLLARPTLSPQFASRIANEARGHPLFIETLVQYNAGEGGVVPQSYRLEDALAERISTLTERARGFLELLSVARSPLELRTAARAARLPREQFGEVVDELHDARMVRVTGFRQHDVIEPYHDRIRQAALTQTQVALPELHRRVAHALERADRREAEVLFAHWSAAGDRERALSYAIAAGDEAAHTLAFERAIRMYRHATELAPPPACELTAKLADALANTGQGAEAADLFERAARLSDDGQMAGTYQRRAAEQYLRSGHVDRGIAAITPILSAAGINMPATATRTLLGYLLRKLYTTLRWPRFRFRPRLERELSTADLEKMDVCWSASILLYTVDQLRGLYLHSEHLRLALAAREPWRIARGLALEYTSYAAVGTSAAKMERLRAKIQPMVEASDDPYLEGFSLLSSGSAAYLCGHWLQAVTELDEAIELFSNDCPGATWELECSNLSRWWSLCFLGRLDELSDEVIREVENARVRGDRYSAASAASGFPNVVWLAANDPARAQEMADAAIRDWSQRGFHLQHLCDLYAQTQIALYRGDGKRALALIGDASPAIERSGLLHVEINRVVFHELRARASIAAATGGERDRNRLLARATGDAKKVKQVDRPYAAGLAALLSAQISVVSGQTERAPAHLERALCAFRDADMPLHLAAAAAVQELLPAAMRADVDTAPATLPPSIVHRRRFLAMLAPATQRDD